jgi:hypothetical protein
MNEDSLAGRAMGRSGVSVTAVSLGGYELGPEPGVRPDGDRAELTVRELAGEPPAVRALHDELLDALAPRGAPIHL